MENAKTRSPLLSRISIILSSVCVVHSMVHPFMIMLLPLISQFFGGTIETVLVLLVVPVSILGFLPVWLHHKNTKLMKIFIIGLIILTAAQLLIPDDLMIGLFQNFSVKSLYFKSFFTFIGAFMLAWSTYKNNHHADVCVNPNHDQ
ncbi:MAG TPA: MerC domain-containing protein [Balneolales bacterium]|nr:MerC domain-containing protein [Balneolales bacterium]